jgi:hypothetical protein
MPLRSAFPVALAIVAVSCASRAQDPTGNALGLLDAWLAREAVHSAAYRADPRPGGDAASLPPGRLLGHSPFLGAFTYRPKTYRELPSLERAALLGDPGLRAYLVSIREACDRAEPSVAPPRHPAAPRDLATVPVKPDEMLRSNAILIFLPQ